MGTSPEHKPLLEDILSYREYAKLLSTYTTPLLDAAGDDGRIHTTYKQTGTATGRLSSVNPNLQNIPVRSKIGQTIRGAFVASSGYEFVSMDYSQIELRVLAHLSGDPELAEAFKNGEDIHSSTAMKIFGLNKETLTPESRRLAKAVNFGILYGLSAFGLSRDTGVSPKEAKAFIDAYFGLYSKVKQYISDTIEGTRDRGYCETILGRRRYFPEITSRNGLNRQRAERAAMNAPIQGSAADIIKLAMIDCDRIIREKNLDASICLQIHDELVFELKTGVEQEAIALFMRSMNSAIALNVPLVVNVSRGESWGEL
jgi:DNA polymerase-1